jgi:hypothetical protein
MACELSARKGVTVDVLDSQHPLTMLVEQEQRSRQHVEIDPHHSLASAYVRLLRHFDNRMRAVADNS